MQKALAEAAQGTVDWTYLFRQYPFDPQALLPIEIYEQECWLWSHLLPLFAKLVLDSRREDALRIWQRMLFIAQSKPFDRAIWASTLHALSWSEIRLVYRFLSTEGIDTTAPIALPPEPIDNTANCLAVFDLMCNYDPKLLLQPLCRVSIQLWKRLKLFWPNLRPAQRWVLWHHQRQLGRICPSGAPSLYDYIRVLVDTGAAHMLSQFSLEEILGLHSQEDLTWWSGFLSSLPLPTSGSVVPLELYLRYCDKVTLLFPLFIHTAFHEEFWDAFGVWQRMKAVTTKLNQTEWWIGNRYYMVPIELWIKNMNRICAVDPSAGAKLYAFCCAHDCELLEPHQWTQFLSIWPLHPNPEYRFPVDLYAKYCDRQPILFSLFTEAALHGQPTAAHELWDRTLSLDFFSLYQWRDHLDELYAADPTACTRLYEFCLADRLNPLTPKQWRHLKTSSSCHMADAALQRLANRVARRHRTRNRNRPKDLHVVDPNDFLEFQRRVLNISE